MRDVMYKTMGTTIIYRPISSPSPSLFGSYYAGIHVKCAVYLLLAKNNSFRFFYLANTLKDKKSCLLTLFEKKDVKQMDQSNNRQNTLAHNKVCAIKVLFIGSYAHNICTYYR